MKLIFLTPNYYWFLVISSLSSSGVDFTRWMTTVCKTTVCTTTICTTTVCTTTVCSIKLINGDINLSLHSAHAHTYILMFAMHLSACIILRGWTGCCGVSFQLCLFVILRLNLKLKYLFIFNWSGLPNIDKSRIRRPDIFKKSCDCAIFDNLSTQHYRWL